MSRPARYHSGSPFVKPRKRTGSKKLGLSIEFESDNHRQNDITQQEALRNLRLQLSTAESEGKYSKARKLRRQINYWLEVGLYLRSSWCYGCNNVLHNCQCEVT